MTLVSRLRCTVLSGGCLYNPSGVSGYAIGQRSFGSKEENERLEEQIRPQLRLITRCTEGQDQVVEHTPSAFLLHKDVPSIEGSPNFLHPLLKALMLGWAMCVSA